MIEFIKDIALVFKYVVLWVFKLIWNFKIEYPIGWIMGLLVLVFWGIKMNKKTMSLIIGIIGIIITLI
ncbi:hypothetical protein [Alkalibacter mobilis]|uniref:hypothetical protein n=1 Tax=Alkalibacter mobilis TaxID=2787712 RepID=UPI00189DA4FF|nr:hypothetical protein [Alkalibacter mobilis]MBF7097590.1 hypothetical protein [Alkalibacter mobilis]